MDERKIYENDEVLFLTEKKRKHLVKIVPGEKFHSEEGFIELSNLIGKNYGCSIKTNINRCWNVLYPRLVDKALKLPRLTQIVYPKDLGYILIQGDIQPGSFVLEAGTGSGVLTMFLANYVKPYGKVYSYDINEQYIENAKKQLTRYNLDRYVVFKLKDVTKEIDEKNIDTIILDIPTPWLVVKNAYNALKPSGIFISLSPTIEQVIETVEELNKNNFIDISTIEILLRNLRVKKGMTRPEHTMRAHTTYITFARKALKEE
jgi:tRNA (adenine57-N1/adenine58-N1)-methyltransferase